MRKHAKIHKEIYYVFSYLQFQQNKKHIVQLNQPGCKHQFKFTLQGYYEHTHYSKSIGPYRRFYHHMQLFLALCFLPLPSLFIMSTLCYSL